MEAFVGENTGAASQYVNTLTTHPISRGVVKDWDQMEKLWHHIAETVNLSSNESTSIFIVESHKSTALDRVKWADLLFDTCHSPSICIGNSASLTIFAAGRTTGVAVECGAGLTSAVPIFEGLALKHAAVSMDFGGQDISFALKKLFNDKNHAIDMLSAKLVKERLSYVHGYATFSGSVSGTGSHGKSGQQSEQATFALPDGTDVTVDPRILSQCTDLLFENRSLPSGGLVSQVHEAIALCDDSVKRDLAANIVLSGGTTMLPGMGDKLNQALTQRFARDTDMRNNMIAHSIRVVPHSNYR
jgi:actin-related protein